MKKVRKMTTLTAIRMRMFLTFVSLTVALTALSYVTFAWFQFNRRAEIGGTNVDVNGNFDVVYSLYEDNVLQSDGVVDFNDFYPGNVHARKLKISVTNFDADLHMTWFFAAPTALQEIAFVDTNGDYGTAGNYYYLGSQIQIAAVAVIVDAVPVASTNAAGTYLVSTSSVGLTKGQVNGVATSVTNTPRIDLVENVLLPFGQTATIEITFTFVDNGTNQNVYKDAWPAVGITSRLLSLYLKNV